MTNLKLSFLELRNAARLLGDQENWKKRLVIRAFGPDVCEKALSLDPSTLEEMKGVLAAMYESFFTEEDKAMEIALKKAADRTYSDDYEDEDDI